ncbi:MAG: extracellular solute-binding protein [Eubacteriales bacterium]
MKGLRILSSIISITAVLLNAVIITACADSGTDSAGVSSTSIETEPAETEIPDNLPEAGYAGYSFTIMTYSPNTYYIQEQTGEIVNDAIYTRNQRVEERFGVEVEVNTQPGIAELNSAAIASVLAGEDAYDIIIPHQIQSGPGFINQHIITDWNKIPYVDTEKPWWNQTINDTINILGKQFYLAGSVTIPSPFCFFFNKQYISDYNLEDLYTTVKQGRWILDYMIETARSISADIDGDGKFTVNDRYGISFNNDNNTLNFMYGCNQLSVIINDEGYPEINVNNDKMLTIINKMYDLIYNDNTTWYTTYSTQSVADDMFRAGNVFLIGNGIWGAQSMRDAEIEFGIIPYPKYDEEQEGYHTHVDAWNGMLCVPVTAGDLERTGIITEAMAAYTYKIVTPVYYEVALTSKYLRDEESVDMLDYIFDGIIYDFGYIFDSWKGTTWTLPNLMTQKKTDFSSYFASKEKSILKHYEQLYESVLTYDD